MFNTLILIIFVNFLRVTYTADLVHLSDRDLDTDDKAAQVLAEIEPNEALPLVLIAEPEHKSDQEGKIISIELQLKIPIIVLDAVIQDGRMVKATRFLNSIGKQMFFCPTQNSKETCLAPTEFGDSEPLQCNREPIPMIYGDPNKNPCGKENTNTLYTIFYEICPDPYRYETTEMPFYEFCYDVERQKTVHTSHIILSPFLISSKILYREQRVKYPIKINNTFEPWTLRTVEGTEIPDLNLLTNRATPSYRLQTLVPDGDMAMALWRKTTHQNFNLEWQHENLITLWNDIHSHLTPFAQQQYRMKFDVRVRTGVFNIFPKDEDDYYKSNIWVKIISLRGVGSTADTGGLAILMNNFIFPTKSEDPTAFLHEVDEAVGNLCPGSCTPDLQRKFEIARSRVRCCSVTTEIANKIGIGSTDFDEKLIYISGINYIPPFA